MQKWEQKKKQKVHQSIVQNAKSSLRRYSNSRDKSLNASRTKPILNSTIRQQIPINKILQIFQLQQYGYLLNLYKFPTHIANMDINNTIYEMVKQVDEKDKERFQSLLNTLIVMAKALGTGTKTPKPTQKSKKIIYPPPQPPSSAQSKQIPLSLPKSDKTNSKFRIKVKAPTYTSHTSQKNEDLILQNPIKVRNSSKQIQALTDKTTKRRKSISHFLNNKKKGAADDLSLVHDFGGINNKFKQGTLKNIRHQSKIIKKLTQKLNQLQHPQSPLNDDIKLDMKKIQQMYLSFDSATMTSNIINIDLQQIIQCYAKQILSILAQNQIKQLTKNNQDRIKSLLRQSFIIVREQQRQTQITSPQRNKQILLNPQLSSPQIYLQNTANMNNLQIQQKIKQQINFNQTFKSQSSIQSDNIQIQLKEQIKQDGIGSSIWGNNYIVSVINDFSCFDHVHFSQGYQQKMPILEDIKYFIELITMAGRLEKQIPILAHVYLKRLLKSVKGSKLTTKNWKNIVLITLIQASKIWDDRSLQNHSFAKILQPYTTLQINRLQKYLLFFIDYHLNIDQKQYSQSYFCLRKHAGQNYHTVHLARLDLRTIKKLQSNDAQQKIQKISKKQFLRKCMNKSF